MAPRRVTPPRKRSLPAGVLIGLLCAAAPPRPATGQLPATPPEDSASRADSLVHRLAPLEVLASILPAAAGPRARSGVPARTLAFTPTAGGGRGQWPGALLSEQLAASQYDDLGSPFKQTLLLRGFSASPVVGLPQGVSVLLDGVPMNEPGAGEVNFDLLPMALVERVEVLLGTASLLGPNSLGGAVNLVTLPAAGPGAGYAEVGTGSFGARALRAVVRGEAAGAQYALGGAHERETGWRADMGGERSYLMASAARLGPTRGVRLSLVGAHSDARTAGSLPLSVYRVNPDSNLTAGDFERLRQLHAGLSGYARTGGGIASVRWFARVADAERFNVNQAADPDVRGFTDTRTLGLDADWSGARSRGGAELSLRLGGGGLLNRTAITLHTERIDPGITTDVHSNSSRVDLYGLAGLSVGPAAVTAGLRWDAIRVPFRNRLRPARDTTSTFARLSPRAGLSVALGHGASAYTSIGRSFRPPALIEIACADPNEPCPLPFALGDDPPIEPVRVTTRELGAGLVRNRVALQLALYRSDVYDDIFLFPYADEDEPEGSTIDGYFDNVPHTRREGLEAGARLLPAAPLRAWVGYAFTRATFRTGDIEIFSIREAAGHENEVEVGNQFPLVPGHTLSGGADLDLPHGVSLGATAMYVGRRYLRGDEANQEPMLDAYATLDARLAFERRRWHLEVSVRNVTAERYAAFGTFNINQGAGDVLERFLTPGRPRSFDVAFRRDF